MVSVHPWNADLWRRLTEAPGRLPHALLLHGPRGIGKKAFALELGRWLLCQAPVGEAACGVCAACGWFDQDGHPDFRLVEPAAEGGGQEEGGEKRSGKFITVNDIRSLADFFGLAAHQGGWRVVVIHPAELLNTAAANALLKTLEEPPPRVLLLLVAHQPRRLLPTVLSRCRKLAFGVPPRDLAGAWLAEQGLQAAAAVLDEAGGAPLLAAEWIDADRLERRRRFLLALAQPSPAVLSGIAQEFQQRVEEVWRWLSRWLYDLQSVRAAGRPRYFPEATPALRQLAGQIDAALLWDLHGELLAAGRWLRHPLNGQLLLESWLLRYAEMTEV